MEIKYIKEQLETNPEELKSKVYNKAFTLIDSGNLIESDQLAILLFEIDKFITSPSYSHYAKECKERKEICNTNQKEIDKKIKTLRINITEIFECFMWFKDNHVRTSTSLFSNPKYNDNPEPIWYQIQLTFKNEGSEVTENLISLMKKMSEQIDFFSVWPCELDESSIFSLICGKAIKKGKYLEFYNQIKKIEHIKKLIKNTESEIHKMNKLQDELQKNNSLLWSSDIDNFSHIVKSRFDNPLCNTVDNNSLA